MSDRVSRRAFLQVAGSGAIAAGLHSGLGSTEVLAQATKPASADWSMEATIIESCTCTMFCPCYFSTVPTGHGHGNMAEHYCRFNMGHRVNRGTFRGVSLAGVKFWLAGDLGADFSKGGEWVEATFEPSVTKEQRDALTVILPHAYPVTWKSFTVGKDAPIGWSFTNERAVARLLDVVGEQALQAGEGARPLDAEHRGCARHHRRAMAQLLQAVWAVREFGKGHEEL